MRLVSDLRYLRRSVVRSPGQAVAIWVCTAIWVGAVPAILSLFGTLQWESLPFPDSDRVVKINAGYDLLPILTTTGRFQAVSVYDTGWLVTEGPRGTATVIGAAVDEGFFRTVGIRPVAGQVFSQGSISDEAGGAVLTTGLSRRLFGAASPIGALVRVGNRVLSVQGVVSAHPVFPTFAELWVLTSAGIRPDPSFLPQGVFRAGMVGRLAESTSLQAAATTVRRVAREYEARKNILQGDVETLTLEHLLRRRSGGERGILAVSIVGLLGFVLLAYTSALAGFLAERQGEFAARIALGARRIDLIRLLLLYALTLSVPGFLAGLPIAFVVLRRLSDLVPRPLAELIPPTLDLESLGLSVAGWGAVALLSVALVWLSTPQIGLASMLVPERAEARRTHPQARIRLTFVCAGLSLAVALGAGAAVLRRSLVNLERVALGFEPRNMASAVVRFKEPPASDKLPALLARLAGRLEGVGGVTAVSFSDSIPIAAGSGSLEVSSPDRSEFWLSQIQGVHGDYLRAAGLRLLAGRDLDPVEQETGAAVALLDESGARELFGRVAPVGKAILLNDRPVEIVGVVSASKNSSVEEPPRPKLYLPLRLKYREKAPPALAVLVRLSRPVSEADLAAALAGTGATLSQYRPLPEIVEASLAPRRLALDLATLQWTATLALVALATFGTFSWLLEVRSMELAVRLALGDTKAGIARRVLGGALWAVAISILVGLAIYLPAGQALRALLFGVEPLSPAALLEAIAVVGGVALGAAALAVWAALRGLSHEVLSHQKGVA